MYSLQIIVVTIAPLSNIYKYQTSYFTRAIIHLQVPKTPVWEEVDHTRIPNVPQIDQEMINHLERVSLVEFNNQAGIERLSKAIESANKLHMVNTDGIEPMESVLEDR